MLRTIEKIGFIRIERIWFLNEMVDVTSDSSVLRFIRLNKTDENNKNFLVDSCLTLITDLMVEEDKLFLLMNKQVRYEIRRALKEDITVDVFTSEELKKDKNILEDFVKVYTNFCEKLDQQFLIKDLHLKRLISYIESGGIILTRATYLHGKVYHMYVNDNKYALLIFSASDFRNDEVDANLAGRANKLLHYKDIQLFKELGNEIYDWGNITSIDDPNGIDLFKASFGGKAKYVYNVFVGNTFFGKLLIKVRKLFYVMSHTSKDRV